jgi:hypothetical protein
MKIDPITASALLAVLGINNTEEVLKVYKLFTQRGGEGVTPDQIKWFLTNKGKQVKVNGTDHVGIVFRLNESTHGMYNGLRYPIYVEITKSSNGSTGAIFEYSIDQLEIIS